MITVRHPLPRAEYHPSEVEVSAPPASGPLEGATASGRVSAPPASGPLTGSTASGRVSAPPASGPLEASTAWRAFEAKARRYLDRASNRRARRAIPLPPPTVRVSTPQHTFTYGNQGAPFHAASITKLVVAALVGQLMDEGTLDPGTRIASLLPASSIAGLFEYQGTAYASKVTIEHLLTHTSGVNDYFEGVSGLGRTALEAPERWWSPAELVDHTRHHQKPVGHPGAKFRYSDTGYALLGELLQAVSGTPYTRLVHERIFDPLGMDSARVHLLTAPANGSPAQIGPEPVHRFIGPGAPAIAPVWFGRTEVSRLPVLSLGHSPGDIAATPADLDRLGRALFFGDLLSPTTRRWLGMPRHTFQLGIRYGAGVMELRPTMLAPLYGRLPRPRGHLGVFGTALFAVPRHEAIITLNLHSSGEMRTTVVAIMEILRMLEATHPAPGS